MDNKVRIKITSLGGSGEDSRNCFLVESESGKILLDCGVRREIADVSTVYPMLTEEIAANLDAVLLSHAHEDHTAALPYLYELGYRGNIYAFPETISLTHSFMQKWVGYVKENGGTLPFREENIEKLSFRPVDEFPFPVRTGRDGHMAGGSWYLLHPGGHPLLYTGDLTYDSLLLEADPLPEAEILIIDSAYAGQHLDQAEQYNNLYEISRTVTERDGKLLLPVPANGRGIDMLVWLSRFDLPLYAESSIIKNMEALAGKKQWLRPGFQMPCRFTAVDNTNRTKILTANQPGVFLFGDGMMTSAVSGEYLDAVRNDSRSGIIISGHTAKGTLANQLLREEFRSQNGIRPAVRKLTIKVHCDEDDVLRLVSRVNPEFVMLFHSKQAACTALLEKLAAENITAVCGTGISTEIGPR